MRESEGKCGRRGRRGRREEGGRRGRRGRREEGEGKAEEGIVSVLMAGLHTSSSKDL